MTVNITFFIFILLDNRFYIFFDPFPSETRFLMYVVSILPLFRATAVPKCM